MQIKLKKADALLGVDGSTESELSSNFLSALPKCHVFTEWKRTEIRHSLFNDIHLGGEMNIYVGRGREDFAFG